jgi:lysophospholipase L1-like esterase
MQKFHLLFKSHRISLMEGMKSLVEFSWTDLISKGYVYGIPSCFNGEFNQSYSNRDKNQLKKGLIHRFPSYLRKKLPYLTERSMCTSGVRVEFLTDAQSIHLLTKTPKMKHRENFSNMAQGMIDILVDGAVWSQHYTRWESPERIFLPKEGMHRISLVFPNYASIILSKILLHDVSEINNRNPEYLLKNRPIVYYGSSITQGGCSSRPSLSYPHQLSETFCINYVNLGISGNARGELEMAKFIAKSFPNAVLYVLDWGANLIDQDWDDLLEQRYELFWRTLHTSNPNIPILFVGLQNFLYDLSADTGTRTRIQYKREFIEKEALAACGEVNQGGKRKLFDYIDGTSIIDTKRLDMTIDGVHPSDIGHKTYAELLEWKIIDLLGNHVHT